MITRVSISFFFLILAIPAYADKVFLQSGGVISANEVWQDNEKVYASNNGNIMSFDLSFVKSIESSVSHKIDSVDRFTFDIWTSGQSIEDILKIAQARNVPLRKEGLVAGNKGYKASVSAKYAKTATAYYYRKTLLSNSARVELKLTPKTKQLHSLYIRWNSITVKDWLQFVRETRSMLDKKYDVEAEKIVLSPSERVFLKQKLVWKISDNVSIVSELGTSSLVLKYQDQQFKKLVELEEQSILRKKRREGFSEDIDKF